MSAHPPELCNAENHTLASLEGQRRHLASVTGGVDDSRRLETIRAFACEYLENDERREEVDRIEETIGVLENGVDVALGPGGIDHDEAGLAERVGVVVHEEAVISVRMEHFSVR